MRIEANTLWKIIISFAVFALVLWSVAYFLTRSTTPIPAPVPDQLPRALTDEERLQMLDVLKSNPAKPLTQSERDKMLKELKSAPVKPLSDAERTKLLESLKTAN